MLRRLFCFQTKDCIPVGCVPPARNRTGGLADRDPLLDRNPTSWTETPSWTGNPLLERDPPGQRLRLPPPPPPGQKDTCENNLRKLRFRAVKVVTVMLNSVRFRGMGIIFSLSLIFF